MYWRHTVLAAASSVFLEWHCLPAAVILSVSLALDMSRMRTSPSLHDYLNIHGSTDGLGGESCL